MTIVSYQKDKEGYKIPVSRKTFFNVKLNRKRTLKTKNDDIKNKNFKF